MQVSLAALSTSCSFPHWQSLWESVRTALYSHRLGRTIGCLPVALNIADSSSARKGSSWCRHSILPSVINGAFGRSLRGQHSTQFSLSPIDWHLDEDEPHTEIPRPAWRSSVLALPSVLQPKYLCVAQLSLSAGKIRRKDSKDTSVVT